MKKFVRSINKYQFVHLILHKTPTLSLFIGNEIKTEPKEKPHLNLSVNH